jgi:mannose-6-phosphate isomerase-like protein (cupin superfamily)
MANSRVERWKKAYAPNPAMLRILLEKEGYRVYHWVERSGTVYGLHKHEEDQSHWIISGELELTFATGAIYTLKAGDRDFISAKTLHKARVSGAEPVSYLVGEKIKVEKTKRKRGRPKKL